MLDVVHSPETFPVPCRSPRPFLPLLAVWPWLTLIWPDWVQHDLVGVLWVVRSIALAPVVGYCIGEDTASSVEGSRADCASNLGVTLQSVFGVLVPEMESAIAACSTEGTVLWVEGDSVDRVDVRHVALVWRVRTMAFEAEIRAVPYSSVFLSLRERCGSCIPGVLIFNILNRTPALDTANGEARSVRETANNACLPLQGACDLLVEFGWIGKVNNLDKSVRCSNYEHLVPDVHRIYALSAVETCNRLLLT